MARHAAGKSASIVSSAISATLIIGALLVFPHISFAAERFETPVKFSVSPSTGAAIFNIPIEVPPGTANMAPSLSFNYNSLNGDGLLGMGWSLNGLSAITRCNNTLIQDGVNTGVQFSNFDNFCLDGQRLVAVTGAYGAIGTVYRTERESFTRIVSYGTVIDSLGRPGIGPAYFIATTKEGHIIEFGNTPDSLIKLTSNVARAYAVNRISDRAGNYMTVTYENDLVLANSMRDYRPLRIDYTGNTNAGTATYNSVRFLYEVRPDVIPKYNHNLAYVNVIWTGIAKRLTNVQTYTKVNGVDTLVKDYRLTYANNALPNNLSRLVSVQECPGDGTTCLPATVLGWQTATGDVGFATPVMWGLPVGAIPLATADFNTDGFQDLLYGVGNSIYVNYSTGSGWYGAPVLLGTDRLGDAFVGDLNGDGLPDVIFSNGSVYLSWLVRSQTGLNNTQHGFKPGVPLVTTGMTILCVGDFDGDGKADLVYSDPLSTDPTALRVSYSTNGPIGFSSFSTIIGHDSSLGGQPQAVAGDVDGDGRDDVITGGGTVYFADGRFLSWPSQAGVTLLPSGDFNGDGLADVMFLLPGNMSISGNIYTVYSTDSYNPINLPVLRKAGQIWAVGGDMNGDGKADILSMDGQVSLATFPTPDLMNSLTSGLGVNTTITYKKIADPSVYSSDPYEFFPTRNVSVNVPLYVVSSSTRPDGIGGTRSLYYTYTGGKSHLKGGGFLGFRQGDVSDPSAGIRTSSAFRQDYPLQGLLNYRGTFQSLTGQVIHSVSNTWTAMTYPDSITSFNANINGSKHNFPALTGIVDSSYELDGSLVVQTTTNTTFDLYGNPTSVTTATNDGFSKTITNTYAAPDLTNWFVDLLLKSTVTSSGR